MFQRWLSPQGVRFASPAAEKAYQERVTRIKDAIQLKKVPDRVPVFLMAGFFPAYYSGITPREAMYDYEKLYVAWKKYMLDFEPDAHNGAAGPGPGKLFEVLDYKLYNWPGHGISPDHPYQCLEGEYVRADEYDALIQDPSDFFRRVYLPRVFGSFEPFRKLPPLTNILELPITGGSFAPYGLPEVQAALTNLLEAGREAQRWAGFIGKWHDEMVATGFPAFAGGFTKAPFDTIGDTLRGTRGIMMDMYRQPDKLLEALEAITPLMIKMGVAGARANGNPIVVIPLHKGADGFLSDKQFRTFYWPTFRKLLIGLIDEGCVPYSYAEGGYSSRLEIIRDLPGGKAVWAFDQTDMARAKKVLGDTACIGGNLPITLLSVGTPQQVKDFARRLIDTAGKDGGYIMVNGAVIDEARPENIHAMIDFTRKYGVYK
ncbi:MAG: hypothetical protein A2144_05360 [Chloroflexi bacterium RBG_16_50_9]|nr:MAG: hypothetical protein A2144_05360 [Chloroflexi bacterium RBG_16_50_9]